MKEEEPPVAELDAEAGFWSFCHYQQEQKSWFLPRPVPDIAPALFNSSFTEFSLPSGDEDFAEVRYEWATESASKEYLRRKPCRIPLPRSFQVMDTVQEGHCSCGRLDSFRLVHGQSVLDEFLALKLSTE